MVPPFWVSSDCWLRLLAVLPTLVVFRIELPVRPEY